MRFIRSVERSVGWLICLTSISTSLHNLQNGYTQRTVFPGGHPSEYRLRSTILNYSEQVTELALVC